MTKEAFCEAFFSALSLGDASALEPFYAEQVTFEVGSEFLKSKWGLSKTRDRNEAETHPRADVLAVYQRFFDRIGPKWTPFFEKLTPEQRSVIDEAGPAIQIMKNDRERWLFRIQPAGEGWEIHAELTDY